MNTITVNDNLLLSTVAETSKAVLSDSGRKKPFQTLGCCVCVCISLCVIGDD